MTIAFNNIPTTVRTPGVYAEIDNSRALQGLIQNPHKALILGQKIAAGTAAVATLQSISREDLADGYFGPGSILSRMCKVFKKNNPNTELWAMALSATGGVAASATIKFSVGLSATGNSASGTGTYYLLINGQQVYGTIQSGWSVTDVNSLFQTTINTTNFSHLPVKASTNAASALNLIGCHQGEALNYIDIRANYYTGQSLPKCFPDAPTITGMAGGTVNPDLGDAWAVVEGEQFHYIIQPYLDTPNFVEIETELADRFLPLEDLQGHGFTAVRGTQASCTTLGNSRNSPHNTIIGFNDSPTDPAEWAAALGAVAAEKLNNDPARPLQFLRLKEILPPPIENRFTRPERDVLLYDGVATFIVDSGGNVLIERCITSYQKNALGLPDPSYLDVQTLATLGEIRFQYKARMANRFIVPRFKLADDGFPVTPGSFIATPATVKQETIALFKLLYDRGLVENFDDFRANLVVERDLSDRNRVNVLLPPDLVNQFRILAGLIQFIL